MHDSLDFHQYYNIFVQDYSIFGCSARFGVPGVGSPQDLVLSEPEVGEFHVH